MYSRSTKGQKGPIEIPGSGRSPFCAASDGEVPGDAAPGGVYAPSGPVSTVAAGPTGPYHHSHALGFASDVPGTQREVERRRRPRTEYEYDRKGEEEVRILFHMCCGPCSIYPIKELLKDKAEVWGFFYNPNIHPLSEFKKRLGAVKTLAGLLSINVICDEAYRPVDFMKNMKASLPPEHATSKFPPEGPRCTYCYSTRLEETAEAALEHGFNAFSSSLLFSKYQNHQEITSLGVGIGERLGIPFYYEDFREGWNKGIEDSKRMGLYRQKYCGCIYSRIERFSKKAKA